MTRLDRITAHLPKRPFAPSLERSKEKNSEEALKVMCVDDYFIEQDSLYDRIIGQPKLLEQLMMFKSYRSSQYFHYDTIGIGIGNQLLKCKDCELVGPYGCILTHMAINHDMHIGLVHCAYCKRQKVATHMEEETFEDCYRI